LRGVGVPEREFEFEFEVETTPESKGEFLSEFEEFRRFTWERARENISLVSSGTEKERELTD